MNTLVKSEAPAVPATVERPESWVAPAVNIYETAEGYVLEADMPGVNKSGLEITVEDNQLTLSGRRQTAPLQGDRLYQESKLAHFRRAFEIDPSIDTGRITARMEQGLLTLLLPKAETAKPRKIAVT